jgi:hypothetical protein
MKIYNQTGLLRQRKDPASARLSFKQRIERRIFNHVECCPRCQKRLALTNRVEIAISLLRTQPQQMDLLARANNSALSMLKHSLRFSSASHKLRAARTNPPSVYRWKPVMEQVLNVAACLFVLVMIRSSVFNSLKDFRSQGRAVLHNYYADNLDSQLCQQIFPDDTPAS